MEIMFEKGIPGFEEYKSFNVSNIDGNEKLKMITSKENSNIGFVSISPFKVKKDYELDLNNEVINELKIEKPEDVLVLNLITLGKTLETSTVNLKAPIIINIKNNKGKQLILQDDKYNIKEPLIGSEDNVSNY
ncbi:flagellar assembly protein FliW [Romboutsia sedimentorum]|uniref:flagellar assembly protein FliW n=1 Tax=Romboutsia sedimentorum TaxID=1368474 RepID=UPI0024DEABED|nr:flagellar assembly protein FliW [Romboutsia sedimentorum]MDK2585814.1 flagellar assembly protein FliW [Romboutsia sedimentorum]